MVIASGFHRYIVGFSILSLLPTRCARFYKRSFFKMQSCSERTVEFWTHSHSV